MKKLFLIALTFTIAINISACGGDASKTTETIPLVNITTEQGINIKLPSDMTVQENKAYTNTETSDTVTFGLEVANPAAPLAEWTKEEFISSELSNLKNLSILSYDNNKKINGNPALVCRFTFKTNDGNATAGAIAIVDDGTKEYIVSFLYGSDNPYGSLAKNLDACINSIGGIA